MAHEKHMIFAGIVDTENPLQLVLRCRSVLIVGLRPGFVENSK